MDVSDQLKQAIRESGLSLSEIARQSGISHPVLSRFLSDDELTHRDIRLETTADVLCRYFGLALMRSKPSKKSK